MTSEEAIRTLEDYRNLFQYGFGCNTYTTEELLRALNMAIMALKQEPVLDKLRNEVLEYIDDLDIAMEICDIFDKYEAESEISE